MNGNASGVRAGGAYVEISGDDTQLKKTLDKVSMKLRTVGAVIGQVGGGIFAGGALSTGLFAATMKSAIEAQNVIRRFNSVFAGQSAAAKKFADELAESTGRNRTEIARSLATYGAFFRGLGYGTSETKKLAQEVAALTTDFSSFYGVSDDESISRFISALSGSSEVLDQFGINIKQAAIEQELLAKGINKSAQNATEQEKTLARIALISKALKSQGAFGDAQKSAGTAANSIVRLRAGFAELATTIGDAVVPVIEPLITKIGKFIGGVNSLTKANEGVTSSLAGAGVKTAVFATATGAATLAVAKLVTVGADAVKTIKSIGPAAAAFAASPITLAIVGIGVAAGLAFADVQKLTSGVADLTGAVTKRAQANEAARQVDIDSLNRLAALSRQTSLSNTQQAEASKLINLLSARYGALGVSLDGATGKLRGFDQAQARVLQTMAKAAKADVNAQIASRELAVKELEKRFRAAQGDMSDGTQKPVSNNAIVGPEGKLRSLFRGSEGTFKTIQDQIDAEQQAIKALRDKLKAIDAGNTETIANGAQIVSRVERNADTATEAVKDLNDAVKSASELNMSPVDREIADLKRLEDQARSLAEAFAANTDLSDPANVRQYVENMKAVEKITEETERKIAEIRKQSDAERDRDLKDKARSRADYLASLEIEALRAAGEEQAAQDAERLRRQREIAAELEEMGIAPGDADSFAGMFANLTEGADSVLKNVRAAFASIESEGLLGGKAKMEQIGQQVGMNQQLNVEKNQLATLKAVRDELKKLRDKLSVGDG